MNLANERKKWVNGQKNRQFSIYQNSNLAQIEVERWIINIFWFNLPSLGAMLELLGIQHGLLEANERVGGEGRLVDFQTERYKWSEIVQIV